MATGGRLAGLTALLKILKEIWPYLKEIIDLWKSLNPPAKQAVAAVVSEFFDLPPTEQIQVVEQLRDAVAVTNQPQG